MDKIIVENRIDLIGHPYFLAQDIRDMDSQWNKLVRQTTVVNMYDNQVGQRYIWDGNTVRSQRTLKDITWDKVICGQVLLWKNVNPYNLIWNLHCQR